MFGTSTHASTDRSCARRRTCGPGYANPTTSHLDGGSHELSEAFRRHTIAHTDHPLCLIPGLVSQAPAAQTSRTTDAKHEQGPVPVVVHVQRTSEATRDKPVPTSQPVTARQTGAPHHIRERPAARQRKPCPPPSSAHRAHRPAHNIRPRPPPLHLNIRGDSHVNGPATPAMTVIMDPNRMHRLPGSHSRAKVECVNRKGQKLFVRVKQYLQRSFEKLSSV